MARPISTDFLDLPQVPKHSPHAVSSTSGGVGGGGGEGFDRWWVDAPMSYLLAKAIRSAALAAGWHTANTRYNHAQDAKRDLGEFKVSVGIIREDRSMPPGAVDHLEELMLANAWHAANTRKGYKADAEEDQRNMAVHQGRFEEAGRALGAEVGPCVTSSLVLKFTETGDRSKTWRRRRRGLMGS